MSSKLDDKSRVVRQVRILPGGTAGAVAWSMIGGRFDAAGYAVASDLGSVSPGLFVLAAKAGTRLSEASKGQSPDVVRSSKVRFKLRGAKGQDVAYYAKGGARAVPVPGGERVEVVSHGVAKPEGSGVLDASAVGAGVGELADWLED